MPVLDEVAVKRPSRRALLLTIGPVVGVIIGAVTNVLTSRWNWWLFSILVILVGLTAVVAVALDEGAQARHKARSSSIARRRKRPPAVNTLPRDISDFTGRQGEISLLIEMIGRTAHGRSGVEVYSIEGMGGIGKTSLAVHVAYKIADRFPDAVLFIDLRAHVDGQSPVTPSDVLATLLTDLGVLGENIPDSLEGRLSVWRRELADARVLVILDNASGVDQVRNLLAGSEKCAFIITGRERLIGIPGVFSVPIEALSPADAAILFGRVLGTDAEDQQKADIAEITRRLDGLPLAIRLAAARIRAHPTWTVRDMLNQDIRQDVGLERVYALSYQDLDPDLRAFFRLLSVHPGSEITAEAAAVLTGTSLRVASANLEKLYSRYLLAEPVPHRFKFHDLIKDFANREGSGMNENAARQDGLHRLLEYYAFMAESASQMIGEADDFAVPAPAGSEVSGPSDDSSALDWFDNELGNLLSCAYYASSQAILPIAWQLPASMTYYLRLRGFLGQAVSLLDGVLQVLETREADLPGEAIVRRRRGQLARLHGDFALSRAYLERSMELVRELDNLQGVAWCHHELGHLDWAAGNLVSARQHFTEAVAINHDLGSVRGLAPAEMNLGAVLHASGDLDGAREYLSDALRIHTDSHKRRGRAASLYLLGALERDSGNVSPAREMITEALGIYDGVRNRQGQAECHLNLAVLDRIIGGYEQSRQHLNVALGIYVEIGYRRGEANTYAELAATAMAAGDSEMALVHRRRSEEIRESLRQS